MKGRKKFMSANLNVNENINSLFERLEKFLTSKTVIGEPIQIGDATLVPIINVSFGLGSGGGDGTDSKGNGGVGGGAGIGARVSPTAIIVIKGDKIEMMPIKKSSGLEKLVDMVPGIVEKIKCEKEEKKQGNKEE
jgi:uncharacterized spore protein YtfJ